MSNDALLGRTVRLDRSYWGGPCNAESKLLLLAHAFDDLGLARIALRTDNLNIRSQQAMTRLGLVYEGTSRSHTVRQDGTRRDSMYYSVLVDEWPSVRDKLVAGWRPSPLPERGATPHLTSVFNDRPGYAYGHERTSAVA